MTQNGLINNIKDKSDAEIFDEIMSFARNPKMPDLFVRALKEDPIMSRHFKYMITYAGQQAEELIDKLDIYSKEINSNFIIGVSGGADSAVVLGLLKEAQKTNRDINIFAYTLPIHQNSNELDRAKEVCDFFGQKLTVIDLSDQYDLMNNTLVDGDDTTMDAKIRRGNLRARLRMMTLYDAARQHNGVVVSTDNMSEYMAGFWTLHGDVGDIEPIGNMNKSVQIPAIGKYLGLPEHIYGAIPTDGNDTSNDENQIGMPYLVWDIITEALFLSTAMSIFKIDPTNRSIVDTLPVYRHEVVKMAMQEDTSGELTVDIFSVFRLFCMAYSKQKDMIDADADEYFVKYINRIFNTSHKRRQPIRFGEMGYKDAGLVGVDKNTIGKFLNDRVLSPRGLIKYLE